LFEVLPIQPIATLHDSARERVDFVHVLDGPEETVKVPCLSSLKRPRDNIGWASNPSTGATPTAPCHIRIMLDAMSPPKTRLYWNRSNITCLRSDASKFRTRTPVRRETSSIGRSGESGFLQVLRHIAEPFDTGGFEADVGVEAAVAGSVDDGLLLLLERLDQLLRVKDEAPDALSIWSRKRTIPVCSADLGTTTGIRRIPLIERSHWPIRTPSEARAKSAT